MARTKEEIAEYNKKYRQVHKAELSGKKKVYYQSHKVEITERKKEYNQANKAEISEYKRKYYQTNKLEILERAKKYGQTHKAEHAEKCEEYRLQIKIDILAHYGKDGKPACVKCGYDKNIDGLQLDHINGDGAEQRRNIRKHIYKWIVENNYPKGFQTLCGTCHSIKTWGSKYKAVVHTEPPPERLRVDKGGDEGEFLAPPSKR